jgi:hypothetical protein
MAAKSSGLMISSLAVLAHKSGSSCAWPDPEKVDELKVEFCPIIRSKTNEEKSIQLA